MQSYIMMNKFTLAMTLSCVLSSLTPVAIANLDPPNKPRLEVVGTKTENSSLTKGLELTDLKSPSYSYASKEKRATPVLLARVTDDK
jgi:hypothetical protein